MSSDEIVKLAEVVMITLACPLLLPIVLEDKEKQNEEKY